jgi:putative endonuclease
MTKTEPKYYFVYIVRCSDGTYYTGSTNDPEKRVARHNAGKGAKYTRSRGPVVLLWSKRMPSWVEAAREEYRIKQLSKKQKEALIVDGMIQLVTEARKALCS